MRSFFIFSVFYLGTALIVPLIVIDGGMTGFLAVTKSARILWSIGDYFLIGILAVLVILALTVEPKALRARAPVIVYAILASMFLQAGFSILKNAMPFVAPYFADPFMALVDRVLHFGVDPWVIAHNMGEYLPTDLMLYSYMTVWVLPAFALPAVVALVDGNHERIMRTVILYAVAWALIGNVLAFAGLSVGPVYYDRLLGGARFADLTLVLKESGVASSSLGETQQILWDIYTGKIPKIGSGISAFPSVHVSIATVTAIYLCERSKWLFPIAAAFLFMTFYLSVYTGYHYAVDGYASILVVFAVWWWLKRRAVQE